MKTRGRPFTKRHIPWNKGYGDYIKGNKNPRYGCHLSEETRQKISRAKSGSHLSIESKQRISQANKGLKTMLGRHHSAQSREKMSESHRGKAHPNRHPLGRFVSEETKERIRSALQGRVINPGNKGWLGRKHTQEQKEKISRANKGKTVLLETRRKLSILMKQRLADSDFLRRVLSSRRPTDIEERLIDIIDKHTLPYRYTGNGTCKVNGKYPDFVNINNKKVAIDVFGDYWHNPDEIPERKKAFAEWGWELVILWGHEIKSLPEPEIVRRLPT